MSTPPFMRRFATITSALLALACAARLSSPKSARPPGEPGAAEVLCPGRAVAGLPFPIRLVFEGEAEVPTSTGLFEVDNPFSITLRSDEATYVFPLRASRRALLGAIRGRTRGRRQRRRPTFALAEGRTCEIVLDLSGLTCFREEPGGEANPCPFRHLAPGSYTLEIAHPSLRKAPVEIVAPAPLEHRLLARLNNMGPTESIWKMFVRRFPEATAGIDLTKLRPEARAQLGYHLSLARLVHSEAPLAELGITDDDIAPLLPAYRTEALILRHEIELARGDTEAAGKTREAILEARPYAAKALDDAAERGGLVARLRRTIAVRRDSQ